MRWEVFFRPEPEGGFTVLVPDLPGCITYGETVDQAKTMAVEAIGLYLEDMRERGEEIPPPSSGLLTSVEVDLPAA